MRYTKMRPFTRLYLSILLYLILAPLGLKSQFKPTNGPHGGNFNHFAKAGDQLLLGTDAGLYFSNDNGITWSLHPDFQNVSVFRIFSHASKIMLITRRAGGYNMVVSNDLGKSWMPEVAIDVIDSRYGNIEPTFYQMNEDIIVDVHFDENYVSNNFSTKWTKLFQEGRVDYYSKNNYILSLSHDYNFDNGIIKHTIEYYRSDLNRFLSFTIDLKRYADYIVVYDGYILLSSSDTANNSFLISSINNGKTWDTVLTSKKRISVTKFFDKIYYHLSGDSAHYTLDKGQSWHLESGKGWKNFGTDSERIIKLENGSYVQLYGDNFRFFDSNLKNPLILQHGITASFLSLLTSHKGILYASTTNSRSYRSFDKGSTWIRTPGIKNFEAIVFKGDSIVAITQYGTKYRFLFSYDNGTTWDTTRQSLQIDPGMCKYPQLVLVNNRIYLPMGYTLFKSDNWGLTWEVIPFGNLPGSWECTYSYNLNDFRLFNYKNELYLIGKMGGHLSKYNESTQTWEFVNCFVSQNNQLYNLSNYLVCCGPAGLSYTADNGISWIKPKRQGLPGAPYDLYDLNGTWYASVGSYGLYKSEDTGESWTRIVNKIPFDPYVGFTAINNTLFVGSRGKGIWKMEEPRIEIKGTVFADLNNNGLYDNNEYPLPDILLTTLPEFSSATTNNDGAYILNAPSSGDTIRPISNSSSLTHFNPGYYIVSEEPQVYNFGVYTSSELTDLTIAVSNMNSFVPGLRTKLFVAIENYGRIVNVATLKIKLDPATQIDACDPAFTRIENDSIVWDNLEIGPSGKRFIEVNVYTSKYSNLNDTVNIYAAIYPKAGDINPVNNTYSLTKNISDSFISNTIECSFQNNIPLSDVRAQTPLEYTIHFQNTGDHFAESLRITDSLGAYLDLSKLKIISSSHPFKWTILGCQTIEFSFENINLSNAGSDIFNSQGFVCFSIPCKPYLTTGTVIANSAKILFDSDSSIQSNTVYNFVSETPITLSEGDCQKLSIRSENEIYIFPNPANDLLNIKFKEEQSGNYIITLYSLFGQKIDIIYLRSSENLITLPLNQYKQGIYLMEVQSRKTNQKFFTRFIKI